MLRIEDIDPPREVPGSAARIEADLLRTSGADLLASTGRQIHLQRCLGLSTPSYVHHPVAIGEDGHKLSKRWSSDPIRTTSPARSLQAALRFLGQPCPSGLDLDGTWSWALDNWSLSRVPRRLEIPLRKDPAPAG